MIGVTNSSSLQGEEEGCGRGLGGEIYNLHSYHQQMRVLVPHNLNNIICCQHLGFCQCNRWEMVSLCNLKMYFFIMEVE